MSHLGTSQPWPDTWVSTCAGCRQEFQVSDLFSPLDGLGSCSAECDRETGRHRMPTAVLSVRDATARVIRSMDGLELLDEVGNAEDWHFARQLIRLVLTLH